MHPVSIAAVYLLFWTMCLFLVLPFGVRSHEEAGVERGHGHADSAPHDYRFGRAVLWATGMSAVLFGLFYANWTYGWVTIDMLDWAAPPKPQG